jgi:hypothetical protein
MNNITVSHTDDIKHLVMTASLKLYIHITINVCDKNQLNYSDSLDMNTETKSKSRQKKKLCHMEFEDISDQNSNLRILNVQSRYMNRLITGLTYFPLYKLDY